MRTIFIIITTVAVQLFQIVQSLTFLSDLATPCAVIHLDALHKRTKVADKSSSASSSSINLPCLHLPGSSIVLRPNTSNKFIAADVSIASKSTVVDLDDHPEKQAILYLHSRTIEGISDNNDKVLARIDLTTKDPCRLVLGLNNHHTISYYWARSIGYGSSMDAIGVQYKCTDANDNESGILQWEDSDEGFIGSNSNDGKRSEWVNFLRKGDEIQLVPKYGIKSVLANKDRIYGVSSQGRPIGSEPAVVCKYDVLERVFGNGKGNALQPDHADFLGGCDDNGWVKIQGG